MERGRREFVPGRVLLGIAVVAIALAGFLFIASPGYGPISGPVLVEVLGVRVTVELVMAAIAVLGPIIGITWMWRLHRSHREPDVHPWRYRDFD